MNDLIKGRLIIEKQLENGETESVTFDSEDMKEYGDVEQGPQTEHMLRGRDTTAEHEIELRVTKDHVGNPNYDPISIEVSENSSFTIDEGDEVIREFEPKEDPSDEDSSEVKDL